MSAIKSLQKPESHRNKLSAQRQRPVTKSVNLLKFNSGNSLYAVEMSELKKVIMDLISIQNITSQSITTQFIKRNRGQTIIFNLESCFCIQQSTKKNKGNTSILIFNETISGSHVGVLVPGNPEILKLIARSQNLVQFSLMGTPCPSGGLSGMVSLAPEILII